LRPEVSLRKKRDGDGELFSVAAFDGDLIPLDPQHAGMDVTAPAVRERPVFALPAAGLSRTRRGKKNSQQQTMRRSAAKPFGASRSWGADSDASLRAQRAKLKEQARKELLAKGAPHPTDGPAAKHICAVAPDVIAITLPA
jgi:hypothetical protein